MKVAFGLNPFANTDWEEQTAFVVEADRLGVNTVWSAEAWSHDAITPLAYLAAKTQRVKLGTGIVQVGTRTPALLAMTALSMQTLSHGRFLLVPARRSSRAGTAFVSTVRSAALARSLRSCGWR